MPKLGRAGLTRHPLFLAVVFTVLMDHQLLTYFFS